MESAEFTFTVSFVTKQEPPREDPPKEVYDSHKFILYCHPNERAWYTGTFLDGTRFSLCYACGRSMLVSMLQHLPEDDKLGQAYQRYALGVNRASLSL